MKKISIIVPVYNAEKTLEKCIKSLVNQTYKNIEIILVNDGSTDHSFHIIKKYKDQYPDKIVVIDQKNQGIGSTRNKGISISTGEYLVLLIYYVELDM